MGRGANKLPLNKGEKTLQRAPLLPDRRQAPPGESQACQQLRPSRHPLLPPHPMASLPHLLL